MSGIEPGKPTGWIETPASAQEMQVMEAEEDAEATLLQEAAASSVSPVYGSDNDPEIQVGENVQAPESEDTAGDNLPLATGGEPLTGEIEMNVEEVDPVEPTVGIRATNDEHQGQATRKDQLHDPSVEKMTPIVKRGRGRPPTRSLSEGTRITTGRVNMYARKAPRTFRMTLRPRANTKSPAEPVRLRRSGRIAGKSPELHGGGYAKQLKFVGEEPFCLIKDRQTGNKTWIPYEGLSPKVQRKVVEDYYEL